MQQTKIAEQAAPATREQIIERVRDKNPKLDRKLIEHFVTLLENAIHAHHEQQAAYYMNKALFYARKMEIIASDDEIADFYFDETTS